MLCMNAAAIQQYQSLLQPRHCQITLYYVTLLTHVVDTPEPLLASAFCLTGLTPLLVSDEAAEFRLPCQNPTDMPIQVKLLQFVRPQDFDNFKHFVRWRDTTANILLQILQRAAQVPASEDDKYACLLSPPALLRRTIQPSLCPPFSCSCCSCWLPCVFPLVAC